MVPPKISWEELLNALYESIDTDHSGFIEKGEFKSKVAELEVAIPDKGLDLLFAALAKTYSDKVGSQRGSVQGTGWRDLHGGSGK